MDQYDEMPWWCQLLWGRSGAPWYEEIDDPAAFLASIRQQLAGQVDELTDELADDRDDGDESAAAGERPPVIGRAHPSWAEVDAERALWASDLGHVLDH